MVAANQRLTVTRSKGTGSGRWALPLLVALYRTEKDNARHGRRHKTPQRLLRQLTSAVLRWFRARRFVLTADGDYATHELACCAAGRRGRLALVPACGVYVHDGTGTHRDEYFFTTDMQMSPTEVIETYTGRWNLEVGFQKLAMVLESEIDTLAYPKAALFGFAVGVAAYNVMSVVQAALRSEHRKERVQQEVSTYYLAEELSTVSAGMKIAIPWTTWLRIAGLSVTEFSAWLKKVAQHADLDQYKKHPRGPKKKQKKPHYDKRKPHVATVRELMKSKVANK
ncbi:MAG: hypothetical protein L0Z62_26405 [Gemmataceae bacterium]|nr:hypothetical protein [Gemmataceae bacterium]